MGRSLATRPPLICFVWNAAGIGMLSAGHIDVIRSESFPIRVALSSRTARTPKRSRRCGPLYAVQRLQGRGDTRVHQFNPA